MKIVIIGDIGASETNMQAFCNAEKDLFSSEIQTICAEADLVILNLEKPLTDVFTPLGKCPPDFYALPDTINGIKLLHPSVVTLANNHIMDQKVQGLQSTREILDKNGILYVGVGNNTIEARKPIIIPTQDHSVGIYACCEKEFSFATDTGAGANVFDPIESLDDIQELRESCDYLIVLFHGGMQDYPYPTPYQQRVCRKMCKEGADLVVCQHSHIIGCEEKYEGSRIIYGQGNFLLDETSYESWQVGIMVEITIENNDISIEYIPTKTYNHKVILHPSPSLVKEAFIGRSLEIAKDDAVDKLFSDFSNEKIAGYLVKLSGKGRFIRRVFQRLGITDLYKRVYSKEVCNLILDYLYCDSHRETIEYGLRQLVTTKENHKTNR